MDLELKDVSELLNIPENELTTMAEAGTIPAYSIQDKLRFNREEIEEWLISYPEIAKKSAQKGFDLFRALTKGDVFYNVEATSKEEAISTIMQEMAPRLDLDPEVLTEMVLAREELMSTGLGNGFAVPHARDFELPGPHDVVAIAFLKKPIPYDALDNKPVHTLIFLFATNDRKHLTLLSKVAHFISNDEIQQKLKLQPEKPQLLELVKEWETGLSG